MQEYQQGESYKAYQKRYQQENKETLAVQQHQNYLAHREERCENHKQFRKAHPEIVTGIDRAHKHKRKAQKRAAGGHYTPQQLREQMQRQKSKCYYCKAKLETWHVDHIVPLAKGGTNDISNIVLACPSCNLNKHARLLNEWPEGGRLL